MYVGKSSQIHVVVFYTLFQANKLQVLWRPLIYLLHPFFFLNIPYNYCERLLSLCKMFRIRNEGGLSFVLNLLFRKKLLWVVIPDAIVVQVFEICLTTGIWIYPLLSFLTIGECLVCVVPVVEALVDLNELDYGFQLTRCSCVVCCWILQSVFFIHQHGQIIQNIFCSILHTLVN